MPSPSDTSTSNSSVSATSTFGAVIVSSAELSPLTIVAELPAVCFHSNVNSSSSGSLDPAADRTISASSRPVSGALIEATGGWFLEGGSSSSSPPPPGGLSPLGGLPFPPPPPPQAVSENASRMTVSNLSV